MTSAVKRHWPEYLMEATGLGLFMISASGFAVVLFHPTSPAAALVPLLRRALMGMAMGLTAIARIYSPWGKQSGAHFNPAVTLVAAIRRELTPGVAAAFVVVQLVGAFAGVAVAHLMFDLPIYSLSTHLRTGVGQWLSEFVATIGLVLAILSCSKYRPHAVPLAVGAYIASAYWFTASTSFANPAVTLARAATNTFVGIYPGNVPTFVAAQILAAGSAALFFRWLSKDSSFRS